jgi:antitoxin StbD
MNKFYADRLVTLDELQLDPEGLIERAAGPIALKIGVKSIAYLVPAHVWNAVCERLDDIDLACIVRTRIGEQAVDVDIADL